jgi:hypothetical protein
MRPLLLPCLMAISLAACVNPPLQPVPEGPLQFIDLPQFDDQLRQTLEARRDSVKIAFIDRVKPSNLPDRLTPWMSTLRNAGGELKVIPPEGELQPRGLPLLSLIPSLWTLFSAVKTDQPQTSLLTGYDAQILLKIDATGDRVVDSIVFKKR